MQALHEPNFVRCAPAASIDSVAPARVSPHVVDGRFGASDYTKGGGYGSFLAVAARLADALPAQTAEPRAGRAFSAGCMASKTVNSHRAEGSVDAQPRGQFLGWLIAMLTKRLLADWVQKVSWLAVDLMRRLMNRRSLQRRSVVEAGSEDAVERAYMAFTVRGGSRMTFLNQGQSRLLEKCTLTLVFVGLSLWRKLRFDSRKFVHERMLRA